MERIARIANQFNVRSYTLIKYAIDLGLWTLAAPLAFMLRLEGDFLRVVPRLVYYTLAGLPLKALLAYRMGLHWQSWHKVGIRDLSTLLRAIGIVSLLLLALVFGYSKIVADSRSIPLLEGGLALLLLSVTRLSLRLLHEHDLRVDTDRPARRVIVVGAGEAGTLLVREMLRHPNAGLVPIGYLDDEPTKRRKTFVGFEVLGTIAELRDVVERTQADEVLIAMPSAPGDIIRRIVESARKVGVESRIMPGMYDILSGKVSITQIREVDVEDLLRRDPVRLNMDEIAGYLENRVVLVTGAAGSIGSEIIRQVTPFNPRLVVAVDRDENGLYMLERELERHFPQLNFETVVADIQRVEKLKRVFDRYRPHVVFHSAAHKHVSVTELNPDEAVLINVGGTKNVLDVALDHAVERFVNISTDKAIQPTSVMGASKRVAEHLVDQAAARAKPDQYFVSVRFGNVLGSRGSVVLVFKDQIRDGGPVTVTHPKMTRYFMSIPEATQLVLQAAGLEENGAMYMLDMGKPVRIVDLARDLIQLSGFEPDVDIPIQFIGMRPGEKLHEELLTAEEDTAATPYEKIFAIRKNSQSGTDFSAALEHLLASAEGGDAAAIRDALKTLVPSYGPAATETPSPEQALKTKTP